MQPPYLIRRGKRWDKIFRPFWPSPIDTSEAEKVNARKTGKKVILNMYLVQEYLIVKVTPLITVTRTL